MPTSSNLTSLVGATTRYIAGRNAVQTVYWRQSSDGRMLKYNKTFEFDRSQKLPSSVRLQSYNHKLYTSRSSS